MLHNFNWAPDNFDVLGKGTVIGHLLECAGQITGGYFADPGKKDVSGMDVLGHPYADVFPDGTAIIGKVPGTGGVISLATAKEQLLYEVINPHAYYTPDVIADFTTVKLEAEGEDRVRVTGGTGKPRPATYKVSVGYQPFFVGEGEISYGGTNAVARARLAGEIIRSRLARQFAELQVDLIGQTSLHRDNISNGSEPYEIRLRVAGRADTAAQAMLVGEEVEALYTNGPAGGGGARKYVNEITGIISVLIPRELVQPTLTLLTT